VGRAQPRWWRWFIASAVAALGSIAACFGIARAATAAFPSTAGYEHFHAADYTKLTLLGVAAAVMVWPILTLLSTRAWRSYLVVAVLALIGSFAPDVWILRQGQPGIGVAALAFMHVAVALVTVTAVLVLAPQRPLRPRRP
jgi:hypothetical protein